MNKANSPSYDAETQALIHQLAEIQAALHARLGSDIDTVVDPDSGRVFSLGLARPEQERLPEETRSQDEFLERLLDTAPVGIAVIGADDYRYQYLNRYGEFLLNTPTAQIVGRTVLEVMPAPTAQRAMDEIDHVRRTGASVHRREYQTRAGPQRIEMCLNMDRVPLRDGDGQIDRVLLLVTDVTEQVQARKRIEELAARSAAILNSMTDALVLFDLEGNIVDANPAHLRMTGFERTEDLARHVSTFEPEFEAYDMQGHLISLDEWPLARVLRGEQLNGLELRVRHIETGQTRVCSYSSGLAYDRAGSPILGLLTTRDVTAHKEAEARIKELARFPDENPHPVLRVSREGRVLYANPSSQAVLAFWGWQVGEIVPEAWRSVIVAVLCSGSVREIETTYQDMIYVLSLTPVATAGYVNVYGRDITERRRAQDALQESEERLQMALKATNDVVWDWDILHDAQRWNEAGTAVFGWADIVAAPQTAAWWVERVHPDDRQRVADGFHAAVADPAQSRWQDEYHFRKADGSYALVLDRGCVRRDEQGRALRMIGAMQDITVRKQMEKALWDSEREQHELAASIELERNRLVAVLESLPVGVWIADQTGRVITTNAAANRIWAGNAPLVASTDQYTQYVAWDAHSGKLLSPEEYPMTRTLRTGQPVESLELSIRRFDGSGGTVLISSAPIKNAQGSLMGIVAINVDITAQKQVEQALRESEMRFRAAVRNPALVLAQTDRELRYRWIVNPHPDFDPAGMIGKRADELEDSPGTRRLTALKQQVLDSGVGIREEIGFQRSDGLHTYDMVIEPLRDASGEIAGVTTASLDVSKRKQAEEALRDSEARFRAAVRNPALVLAQTDRELRYRWIVNPHPDFDPARVYGKRADELDDGAGARRLTALKQQVLDSGIGVRERVSFERSDGLRTYDTIIEPLRDTSGQVDGLTMTLLDVTERQQAEQALRESEEQARAAAEALRAILDTAPVAVWIAHDPECRQITGNAYADEMVMQTARGSNVSRSALPGEAAVSYRVLHDGIELRPEEMPAQLAAATGRPVPNSELELRFSNGRSLYLLEGAAPLFDAQGNVRGAVTTGVDITVRKQAEEALRRYAQRLDVLREIDQAILPALSEQDAIEAVLSRVTRLLPRHSADVIVFDLAAREMLPLGVSGASQAVLAIGRRQPFAETWLPLLEKLAGGAEHVFEDLQAMSPAEPDLASCQATAMHAAIMMPLWTHDQRVGTLNMSFTIPGPLPPEYVEIARELATALSIGIQQARLYEQVQQHARELEARVRARTRDLTRRTVALEASEARFRAIFEEAAIGIALVNRQGRLLSSNPALQEMLGYSAEELKGMSLGSLLAPGAEGQSEARLGDLFAGEETDYALEQRFAHQNKTALDVHVVVSRIHPRKGRARFAVLMVEDITARKLAQAELIQAEKLSLSGRLAASMAHEINNPLQSVIGCLGLAQEMLADGEDPAEYMRVAMDELDRAARIVHQLRELGRRRDFAPEPTDVNDLVERTLLLTQKRCQNRRVAVTRDLAADLPPITVAPDRIQQVLLNLVLNAIDAMLDGGRLGIHTRRTAGPAGVEIAVTDTGGGIPPERLVSLFQPFQSTKEVGMGIGLHVSREIVAEHEGHIDVESEVGRGTTFTIWLPQIHEPQP